MKLLIDTNIVIGLEDAGIVEQKFADLVRMASENGLELFVHEASLRDVERDKDRNRRAVTKSRFAKFQTIKSRARIDTTALSARFGQIRKDNDFVDVLLLEALDRNAVDVLVTEDLGIQRRAKVAGLSDRVFSTLEALGWITSLFRVDAVELPSVQELPAYQIDFSDAVFDGLRSDYGGQGFDDWTVKCQREHRPCWVVFEDDAIAGIIIRKDESRVEAGTKLAGESVLKLCTFKVATESRGRKLGEQLLKQALWHAQRNGYDLVYLTVYPKQERLIWLLEEFGFQKTDERGNGELTYEKVLGHGRLDLLKGESALEAAHRAYPRFHDGSGVSKFAIPIRPVYHRILFPERSSSDEVDPGRPGNTIKKVYLTHTRSRQMRSGDLIFFYMSQGQHADSQSITSVGVIADINRPKDYNDLVRVTARRSAYTDFQLKEFSAGGPVTAIDFLLVGHLGQRVHLHDLLAGGILNGCPQSVTKIPEERYRLLKAELNLGFSV